MRRLNRPAQPAASAPAAPAAPATPAPAPAQPVATLEPPAPAPAPTSTAVAIRAPAGLPAYQRPLELEPARLDSGPKVPYVMFFEPSSTKAGDVRKVIPDVSDGTPILMLPDGKPIPFAPHAFTVLQALPYWAVIGPKPKFETLAVSLTKRKGDTPEFGPKTYWKEQCLALLLVLPAADGRSAVEVGPGLATVTTFRGPKCTAARGHLDAIDKAMTPEWIRLDPLNAVVAGGVEDPRLRVVSQFKIEARTSQTSGNAYTQATAVSSTVSVAQVQAIGAYMGDAECQAELKAAVEAYDRIANKLREQAKASK